MSLSESEPNSPVTHNHKSSHHENSVTIVYYNINVR